MSTRYWITPPDAEDLIRRWRRRIFVSALGVVSACGSATGHTHRVDQDRQQEHEVEGSPFVAGAPEGTVPLQAVSLLEGANYFAFSVPVDHRASFGGQRGPGLLIEKEGFDCTRLLASSDEQWEQAQLNGECDREIARALRAYELSQRTLLVVDGQGETRIYTSGADVAPIDSAPKAALAAWLAGHPLSFLADADGTTLGDHEQVHVQPVQSGYEVTVGASGTERIDDETEAHNSFRVTLLVKADGSIQETNRVLVQQQLSAWQPPMPLGRRPEFFCDPPSKGTLRGHLARAMHHEAESVRAFERLARELRAFDAPDAVRAA